MVQLQESLQDFQNKGVNIVGLSYDSPEILQDFRARKGISFPLLSDPDSKVLARLGLENTDASGKAKGVAKPGVILLDPTGEIVDFAFEESYRVRPTAGSLFQKYFPEGSDPKASREEASNTFRLSQTSEGGVPGSRWELLLSFQLPQGHHLYSQNEKGYVALKVETEPHPLLEIGSPQYPVPKTLTLVGEEVSVYEGFVQVSLPVQVSLSSEAKSLEAQQKIAITGFVEYQICTESSCLLPEKTEISWTAEVRPLDKQRSPASIQHKD